MVKIFLPHFLLDPQGRPYSSRTQHTGHRHTPTHPHIRAHASPRNDLALLSYSPPMFRVGRLLHDS